MPRTTPVAALPRTEAGRALLAYLQDNRMARTPQSKAYLGILAIEAESRAIAVEDLARSYHAERHHGSYEMCRDDDYGLAHGILHNLSWKGTNR
jgi:hypothetical protein